MLRIFKSQPICHLRNGNTRCQFVFCQLDNVLADMVTCSVARSLFYQVAEIVGRHAELVGAVLHCGLTECKLPFLVEIIVQQSVELHQHIRVFQLPRNELAVVETHTVIEQKTYIFHDDTVLQGIAIVR